MLSWVQKSFEGKLWLHQPPGCTSEVLSPLLAWPALSSWPDLQLQPTF